MIQSLTVTNHVGDTLNLPLRYPKESGFIITNITGLGPAKANINMSDYATVDGASFNSSRMGTRNIVMTLRLLEGPSIEATRHKAYYFFPVKKRIVFRVATDLRISEIVGYVESAEPNIFSPEEEIVISILCPDPDFYAIAPTIIRFYGAQPKFEFPFENVGLEAMLEVGEVITEPTRVIDYNGDDDIGAEFHLKFYGNAEDITIYHIENYQEFHIDTVKVAEISGGAMQAEDEIIIDTRKGHKSIQLLRHGIYTNILNAVDRTSDWLQLQIGKNTIAYAVGTGFEYVGMEVFYYTAYQGV